ncbi:hypothetical protein KFE25_012720 [Diacronema lutheri]|uniref:2Fe-2S ferredoxin-type domain-containing protein n=2 Tax=Diacronema lutheri TaxID=2081491 RepID=A0A8J6C5E1_DIALT|nr:hypothetical protein KFE25_012720 [Diacronema lutheri]
MWTSHVLAIAVALLSGAEALHAGRAQHSRVNVRMGPPPAGLVAVSFNGKAVNVAPGTPLSEAAAKARVRVRYDCKEGKCGMCEVKVNGRAMRTCVSKVPKTGPVTVVVP